MAASAYGNRVFLNVPFDDGYRALFDALVFAVQDCGCVARSSLETDDGSVLRLSKIFDIMGECQYGIHDLSRTSLDPVHRLPHFNMPLELGVFLGAKRFGSGRQKAKSCLILDSEAERYRHFCSNISGQDIKAHNNDGPTAIGVVRNWVRMSRKDATMIIPGGPRITERYREFRRDLPGMCRSQGLEEGSLIYLDYRNLVVAWLQGNPW